MTSYLHANPIEFVYLIVALISTALSVFTLRDAVVDSAYLSAAGKNGDRRMIADINIRQELFRFAANFVMLVVGVAFLFLEPPPPDYAVLPQTFVGLVGWISVATILSIWSLLDKSVRHKLSRFQDSPNPTDPVTGAATDTTHPADDNPSHPGSLEDAKRRQHRRHSD